MDRFFTVRNTLIASNFETLLRNQIGVLKKSIIFKIRRTILIRKVLDRNSRDVMLPDVLHLLSIFCSSILENHVLNKIENINE